MKKIFNYIQKTCIFGLLFFLPFIILLMLIIVIDDLLAKVTKATLQGTHLEQLFGALLGNIILVLLIILLAFIIGTLVRTQIGTLLFDLVEKFIFSNIPGYKGMKKTIENFKKSKDSNTKGTAVFIECLKSNTHITGFLISSGETMSSVYIPGGLHPAIGGVVFVQNAHIHIIENPTDEVFKTIIGCGFGTKKLIKRDHVEREIR